MTTFRTKRKSVFAVLVAGLLVGLLCLAIDLFSPRQPEPQYQGKTLTAWALEIDRNDFLRVPAFQQNRERNQQAIAAIRQIGTNALPLTLKLCRAKDSWLKKRLEAWAYWYNFHDWPNQRRHPIYIKSADEKQFEGINLIWALGPMAEPLVPSLISMLQSRDEIFAWVAAQALPGVGTNAIPSLLPLLHDPDEHVRLRAAFVLGDFFRTQLPAAAAGDSLVFAGSEGFRSQAAAAVPVLLQNLDSRELDSVWHIRTVRALGWIREDAPAVVPALIRHVQSKTNNSRPLKKAV